MRDDALQFEIGEYTFEIEGPMLRDGLRATVTLVEGDELIYSDRINLDRLRDREKWGAGAGVEHKHLLTLREQLANWLAGASQQGDDDAMVTGPDTDALAAGRALLNGPNLLDRVGETIQKLGYAGRLELVKLLYLALTSRLLDKPISAVIQAQSSAGKSYTLGLVLQLMPDSTYYLLTGMSERVLAYTDADFEHRHIIVNEASALAREGIGASLMRSIISEGRITYEVVEKTADGLKPRRIEKEGPTGLLTTSTRALDRELETRLLSLTVPDDQKATRDILKVSAAKQNGHAPEPPDLTGWHAAQWILEHEGAKAVNIPYADQLAELYPVNLVRARRDFGQLLALISSHALLYQFQRDRDDQGRIVANEDDYRAIYDIAGEVFGAVASEGLTPAVRETVDAVASLIALESASVDGVTTVGTRAVATRLDIDYRAAVDRIRRAIRGGWIVNEESRPRRPMQLRLGDAMPEDAPALPSPEKVFYPSGLSHYHHADSVDSDAENGDRNANLSPIYHAVTGDRGDRRVIETPIYHDSAGSYAENRDSDSVIDGRDTNNIQQQHCTQCGGLIANAALQEMGLCWSCAEALGWTP